MRDRVFRFISSEWFIAAAALVLRMSYFVYMARRIPATVLADVPFQNEVGNLASALAEGKGFCCLFRQATGPTAWLAPIYPLMVAGTFKVFGSFTLESFYAVVSLNCIFSSLTVIPLFHAGKRIAGWPTSAVAAWIWVIFPSAIILPFQWIWDTSLSALLGAALLWSTLRLRDGSRVRDSALYGLLWGIALLTNPALGALLPFLLGWMVYEHRGHPVRARMGFLVLGVAFLVCLPWTARNYFEFHRFIPLRSNFPYELWSGNNDIFDPHSRGVNRITRFEQVHLYAELGETRFLHDKLQKSLEFIGAHPRLYAQLVGGRIVATWLGTASPWQGFAESDSCLVRLVLVWNAFALVGVIVGLRLILTRQRRYFVPVACFPVIFPLTFYIAHSSLRHRHPCDPVVALLMAVVIMAMVKTKPFEIV
jgi:hypothetical protein